MKFVNLELSYFLIWLNSFVILTFILLCADLCFTNEFNYTNTPLVVDFTGNNWFWNVSRVTGHEMLLCDAFFVIACIMRQTYWSANFDFSIHYKLLNCHFNQLKGKGNIRKISKITFFQPPISMSHFFTKKMCFLHVFAKYSYLNFLQFIKVWYHFKAC